MFGVLGKSVRFHLVEHIAKVLVRLWYIRCRHLLLDLNLHLYSFIGAGRNETEGRE